MYENGAISGIICSQLDSLSLAGGTDPKNTETKVIYHTPKLETSPHF